MIRSFSSSETEHFFTVGKSRRLPQDILKRAAMRLTQLDGPQTYKICGFLLQTDWGPRS
jgi:hypothetical protein